MNSFGTNSDKEAQILYKHLQYYAEIESPRELIARFHRLFINVREYEIPEIEKALEKLISKLKPSQFKCIFNRSCYILINRWQVQPQLRVAIPQLIALLRNIPSELVVSPTRKKLRKLLQYFLTTDDYLALQRLAQVISNGDNQQDKPLIAFLDRYPYLFKHCLLTNSSDREQRQHIELIAQKKQQQFEVNLSQYITYQKLQKNFPSIKNPTLLSDRNLKIAINRFTQKVDGFNTYHDLAERFRTYSRWTPCYRIFKEEFHQYLIASIKPKYGRHFNGRLYQQLKNILPQHDGQKLNDSLLWRTCKKLLDFLVVESQKQTNHYIFSDLTANLGITPTIELLLKIVLLCRQVKQELEKRVAILFKHYENYTRDKVECLIQSMENLHVAFSLHFGNVNII